MLQLQYVDKGKLNRCILKASVDTVCRQGKVEQVYIKSVDAVFCLTQLIAGHNVLDIVLVTHMYAGPTVF